MVRDPLPGGAIASGIVTLFMEIPQAIATGLGAGSGVTEPGRFAGKL
ncbi:MAG: hypothetical protein ACP5IL_01140 [Syntrophobacteraceae bacterium]